MANLKFLHGNTDITASVKSDSFSCENILCDNQLAFGSCNSARAQFTTITDLNLTGEQITVQYGNGSDWSNLGVYKVTYSSTKENSDEVRITMYDCVKNADVDVANWYIGLTFPMTISAFRNALCSQIGIEQKSVTLVNDSITIYETIAPSKLKATDLLRYIGELNGVFPHASVDGMLDWISLGSVPTTITQSMIHGENAVVQKSYSTSPISRLSIRAESGDIGISVGSGANIYYVTANPLVYGMTEDQLTPIATNLFNKISGITYVPTEMEMIADPTIPMGAMLSYDSKNFYLLNRSTSGLLFDKIKAEGNEYLEEDNSIETSLEQLRGLSHTLSIDLDGISDRVEVINDDYTKYSEFTDTVEGINFEIGQIQSQIDGSIELFYTDEPPTFLNYPYWDWTDLKSDNSHNASDSLYYTYPETELQKHLRSLAYDEDNGLSYRFLKENGQFIWKEIADTETSLILSRLASVEATAEGLTADVSEVSYNLENNYWNKTTTQSQINQKADSITTSVAGTYATKTTTNTLDSKITQTNSSIRSDVAATYATIDSVSSLSSRVTQTESGISAEVTRAKDKESEISGKVDLKIDKDKLVSEFNAKANVITLTSDNFTLSANGKITATAGDIGIWKIDTNGGLKATQTDNEYICMTAKTSAVSTEVIPDGFYIKKKNGPTINASAYQGWLQISSGNTAGNKTTIFGTGVKVETGTDVTSITPTMVASNNINATSVNATSEVNTGNVKTTAITGKSGGLTITTSSSSDKINIAAQTQVTNKCQFYGTVYNSAGGVVFTSDRDKKHDIEALDTEKTAEFVYSLSPVEFKYNDGTSGRFHHGLIAQDVKESMGSDDWGLYVEEEGTKALRYDELIADLIATVQSQNERIAELERMMKDGN